jgi:tetratricopeptide (TPR) repeat protein
MMSQLLPPQIAARVDAWIQRWRVATVCLALAAITFAVFGQTAGFGFINHDDDVYVYENPAVAKGLTLRGFGWALTDDKTDHWHPLTWLTHMADCQVYGLWAGGHHLTNVALQALAAALLFLALREMTGSLWRSAFVAAVFAIHPLRAESVAWIAERKDVLSGVFFMLTLWAYGRYAHQPSRGRYAAVALWYALGLLCKNTLVTLPFVLLLLDRWPLHRMTPVGAGGGKAGATRLFGVFGGLVKEKIPLFALSVGSCVVTVSGQRNFQPLVASDQISFLERLGNAVLSYGVYLRQMVFPTGLANPCIYPRGGQPFWMVALAFVLLAAISISVVAYRKRRPYLLVGWLWYLGILVPVIGIVQISYHAHADRYTYLPGIGLVLAGTWAVGDWSLGWKQRRAVLGGVMAAVIGILIVCAWKQTGYWKSGETWWTHTLDCTTGNYIAQNNLGVVLLQKGKVNEATSRYQKALEIKPDFAEAHNNLGVVLFKEGRRDEAITQFREALQIDPHYAPACNNAGNALLKQGNVDDAIPYLRKALRFQPDFVEAHNNLGNALLQKGRVDEAITQFQKAAQITPENMEAHCSLGTALLQKGRLDEAITQFQEALQIDPHYAPAYNNAGNALLKMGRVDDAIACFQKALQINPGCADAHVNIGNALVQTGKMAEAISHYQKALQIKPADSATQNNLAWILATCPDASLRNGARAVELAQKANALAGGENPMILHTLAASFAETGRFGDAMQSAQKAMKLARAAGQQALAERLNVELKQYQAGLHWSQ